MEDSTRRSVVAAALVLLSMCLTSPFTAQTKFKFVRGQSVFVVAVRNAGDASVFWPCAANATTVTPPPSRDGAIPPELVPPGVELLPGGFPDAALRTDVEQLIRKLGRFSVAATVDRADLVLVVQATYGPSPASMAPGAAPSGRPTRVVIGAMAPELPRNTLASVLAVAVSGTAWRSGRHDGETLLSARVWGGVEMRTTVKVSPDALIEAFSKNPEEPYEQRRPRPAPFSPSQWTDPSSMLNEDPPPPLPDPSHARIQFEPCPAPRPPRAPRVEAVSPTGATAPAPTEVAVPVIATGADGAPVTGLTAADFRVYQDDAEQRVARLLTEAEPLNVVVLLDMSASMRAPIASLRAAAWSFMVGMRPQDALMVASFSGRTYVDCEFTRNHAVAGAAILHARTGGTASRLYDAIDAVLTERLAAVQGRKALVVLTDGMDVDSAWATGPSVLQRVESANVTVSALQYDATADPSAGRLLDDLARSSGGRVVRASAPNDIARAIREIAAEARQQLVLYYDPSNPARDAAFHTIRVEAKRPGVTIRTRTGFRAPRPSPSSPAR